MPMESFEFVNGVQTYRIQFDIVAPPPSALPRVGLMKRYSLQPQYTVPSIRITDITECVGENGTRKLVNFARSFDSVAQARVVAGEYAKRIIREQMTPRPA